MLHCETGGSADCGMMFLQGEKLAGAKCGPGHRRANMRECVPWKGTSSSQQGLVSSLRSAQLASLPRILGSALRNLQERHDDGALVSPGRWDRVMSLGTREQAGVE